MFKKSIQKFKNESQKLLLIPEIKLGIKLIKIGLVIYLLFYFEQIYISFYSADVNYEYVNRLLNERNFPLALDKANTAIKLNPLEPNYFRARARVLVNYLPKQPAEIQKQIKESILKDIQQAYTLNPQNLVTIRNIMPLYYFITAQNILVGASPENIDPAYLPITEAFLEYHKYYSPNDVGLLALIAKYEKRLYLTNDYNDTVAKIKDLRPDILDWFEAFK